MTRIQAAFLLANLVALPLTGCSGNARTAYSSIHGGASATSGGWYFSAGGAYIKADEPGVLFGMRKAPDGNREFAYLVIIRHAITAQPPTSVSVSKDCRVLFKGPAATLHQGIVVNGNKLNVDVEIPVDREAGTIQPGEITINGQEFDRLKGSLFLADATTSPVTVKQIDASLPDDLPKATQTAAVAKLARQVTRQLTGDNQAVRDFLER